MNSDHFEKQLRDQPLRQPPEDWRHEILATAATRKLNQPVPGREPSVSWWRALVWPAPRAWAGLAAMWMLIFLMQSDTDDPSIAMHAPQAAASSQLEYAMQERQQLFAELLNEMDTNAVAEPPRKVIPGPRTEGQPGMVCV
jgi:hypothetical protein